ncbi:MAG: anthranilate phosphoribosyltransferase [Halanaerobiales bacterium]|nr:anthranilate phosphoribosyltransferase [Halanaerobiales bacterium]
MQEILSKLIKGKNLTAKQARLVMDELMEGHLTAAQIGALLTALRIKGETVEEISGFAHVMQKKARKVKVGELDCIDTCGTGGDGSNTYNVSTAVAFVLAAAGVPVAKHGNRSVSSRCGSADVLEALGARVDLPPDGVETSLRQLGIGFIFAPIFHQAMQHAIAPRRELGIRTVFNLLGPLTNPAGAKRQVLGVFAARLTQPLARVLRELGSKRAMVFHGDDGLDELTVTTTSQVSELQENGQIIDYVLDPRELGIPASGPEDLQGGDIQTNAELIESLLAGEKGAKRDLLLLNSAAAFYVAGKASSLREGINLAAETIDRGLAREKLKQFCRLTKGYQQ